MTIQTSPARTAPAAAPCCSEYAGLTRRGLFRGGLAVAGTTAVLGSAVVTSSPAAAASADSVLVVLSLRGAADGLSLVVPHGDPVYYQKGVRDQIAVPKAQLLHADAMFGLHPRLSALSGLWNAGEVAAIQATGLAVANRSHFAAMEEIEDANPGSDLRQGWLNRLIGTIPGSASPLKGFNLGGGVLPTALHGTHPVMAGSDVASVRIPGDDQYDEGQRVRSLHRLWDGNTTTLGRAMKSAFDSVDAFAPATKTADNSRSYPNHDLGRALAEAARVVRGDVGVSVVTVDQGDWDMHSGLGNLEWGSMRYNAQMFGEAVAAFFDDLGTQRSKVTLVAFSEFGRRVVQNSSNGLDHGWGNVMWVMGEGVNGGFHCPEWPGLQATQDADLRVTTDYRDVLSEVVGKRFGVSPGTVFTDPDFHASSIGVMR